MLVAMSEQPRPTSKTGKALKSMLQKRLHPTRAKGQIGEASVTSRVYLVASPVQPEGRSLG